MASASPQSSGSRGPGKKRSLDAEINLVPFIDLLSMCICFLLMTAVWTQMGALQIKQSAGTDAAAPESKKLDLEVTLLSPTKAEIKISQLSKSLKSGVLEADNFPALVEKLDQYLAAFQQQSKEAQVSSGLITPSQSVSYGSLVSLMDHLRKAGISNLGVIPVHVGAR